MAGERICRIPPLSTGVSGMRSETEHTAIGHLLHFIPQKGEVKRSKRAGVEVRAEDEGGGRGAFLSPAILETGRRTGQDG